VRKQSSYGQCRRAAAILAALAFLTLLFACSSPTRPGAPTSSRQTVRLQLPPDQAAACFARNAEEHSSALVAEIRRAGDRAEVIVRVKNGVHYGTGEFQRAGSGSNATLTLNVMTNSRRSDLVGALLEGC
jgi:hypothetical protein